MVDRTGNTSGDSEQARAKRRQAASRPRTHSAIFALLAAAALVSSGCASENYLVLRSESDHPRLASLLEASALIPSNTVMVEVDEVNGQPVRMAVRERGEGKGERLVVLVHGVLTDSRTWRFLEGDLGRDYDLLAMDMIGCGRSDKPDPDILGPDGYSPAAQARRVYFALREVLSAHANIRQVTLVSHSLGGTVTLRMLGDRNLREEFSDVYAKFDQAVLFAPADVAIEKVYPVFREVMEVSDVEVFLGSVTGILEDRCAKAALDGAVEREEVVPREEADQKCQILGTSDTRHAAQAQLRQAVPFTEEGKPIWPEIERLEANYGNIEIPCLIVWGRRDETLPVSMGYKLAAQIPSAKLTIVTKTKHSPQMERPRLSAGLVRRFILTGDEGWPSIGETAVEPPAGPNLLTSSRD